MVTVTLSPLFNGWQGLGSSLVLLNGGLLNSYLANSTTPAATYTTVAGNVQNTNPIVLNSDGRPPQEIWLDTTKAYKFVLTDSLANVLGTYDNVYPVPTVAAVQSGAYTLLGSVAGTNTITATGSPTLTAYASGQVFTLVPANTNTGAATLNVDGLGAKNLFSGGAACTGGELRIATPVQVEYDGTQFNVLGGALTGAWTPVLGGAGGTSGQTYSTQAGFYEKIGRLVFVSLNIQLSNKGTITGACQIQGLPFTSSSNAPGGLNLHYFINMGSSIIDLKTRVEVSGTVATIDKVTAAATTTSTTATADISATTQIIMSGSYLAAT